MLLAEATGSTVLAELGRGAQTVVYRIRRDHADWAAKIMLDAVGPDAVASFRREAALLAWVKHPGLVGVHDVGDAGGRPFLVMDLVEGRTLADELRAGAMAEQTVVRLVAEVADALGAAHRVGLVHRDVKPENIVVQPDGRARVIDFGMATRAVDDPTGDGRLYGTLGYCSPEQAGVLRRPVDRRADLYSLGVVLYECLTGVPPFSSSDAGELIRLHATAPAPDPRVIRPELSPTIAAIVGKLLAKDPDDRYASGAGLAADLRRLLTDPGAEFVPGATDEDVRADPFFPLVGRDAELGGLLERWQRARDGAGRAVALRGPAGAGRSRLATELAARARADGRPVILASCAADDPPLAPLRRAVEQWLGTVSRQPADQQATAHELVVRASDAVSPLLRRLSPALTKLLGPAPPSTDTEITEGADAYAREVAAFLSGLAQAAGGTALCLDDAQWADESTIRVLRHLTARIDDVPLLILVTELEGAPAGSAARAGITDVVELAPLDRTAVHELIGLLTAPYDAPLVDRLAARCGSTPAAVVEYMYVVLDSGMIRPHWGRWVLDLDGLDRIALPEDVAGLILRRVDGLGPQARNLLTAAAAVGIRFAPAIAAVACGVAPDEAADILGSAVARRVLEDRDGDFAFVHDGIRARLLADLDSDALRCLHQRIADALTTAEGPTPGGVYALARHLLRGETARNQDQLVEACVAAGQSALADQAPYEAVEFLEQAALASPDAVVGQALGAAYQLAGRLDDAVRTFEATLPGIADPLDRADILVQMTRLHETRYDIAAAQQTAVRAFAELGRPLPSNPVMLAVTTLGMLVASAIIERTGFGFGTATGSERRRLQYEADLCAVAGHAAALNLDWPMLGMMSLRAVYPADRVGSGPVFCRIQFGKAVALRGIGFRKYRRSLRLAWAEAEKLNEPGLTAYLTWFTVILKYVDGTADDHTIAAGLARHGRYLDPGLHANALVLIGGSLLMRGYAREARALYETGQRLLTAADLSGHSLGLIGIGAAAALGRMSEADAQLRPAHENPSFEVRGGRVDLLTCAARVAVEQRDTGRDFEQVTADFATLNLSYQALPASHRSIYVYLAYGRIEQCRVAPADRHEAAVAAVREAVETLAKAAASPCLEAHLRVCRAALQHLSGEHDRALDLLAGAERVIQTADAPLAAFEAARVKAAALSATGYAHDAETAATAARSIAHRNGWPHRAEWIRTEAGLGQNAAQSIVSRSLTTRHTAVGDNSTFNPFQQRLAALERLSLAASRIIDPDELTRVTLDEIIRLLGAERAFLFLAEDDSARLVPHLGRDDAGHDLTELTAYGSTLVERARHRRNPIVVTGTDDGDELGSQSIVVHGLRSIMVAPIQLDNRLLGVVYLDSRIAKGMFSESDAGLLNAITNHIASALETTRAARLAVDVESAQRQRDMAETLRSAMTEFGATLVPEDVLRRIRAALARVLGADDSWLAARDGDKLAVYGPAEDDPAWLDAAELDRLLPAGPDIVGGRGGTPLGVVEPAGWLAVPLINRGDTPVGAVLLTSVRPDTFGDTEREVAAALVGQGMTAYDNAVLFAEVQRLATTDSLTGLLNRRQLFSLAHRELAVARRRADSLAAAMVDIDHFKRINDRYGHGVGDQVIRAVAGRIRQAVRTTELIGRYGGEEFALILPDVGTRADEVGERIRSAVGDTSIDTDAGPLAVTASAGVAVFDFNGQDVELDALLARADRALYDAKEAGRNRVVVYPAGRT